jgi:hypothetical protein
MSMQISYHIMSLFYLSDHLIQPFPIADHPHSQSKRMQPLYGIVLYDFQAERADELQAKAGEPIIVIAQSNLEWFVAKPIGRLGGPGLIPVSFVEIRDAVTGRTITNVADLMQNPSTPIPKVEEWKKMTQGYEASSILLGSIEKQKKSQELQQRPERPPTVGQMLDILMILAMKKMYTIIIMTMMAFWIAMVCNV